MTQREYNQQAEAINAEIEKTNQVLAHYDEHHEQMSSETLSRWNDYHDLITELKEDLATLERAWGTRHWTLSDFESARLISLNID